MMGTKPNDVKEEKAITPTTATPKKETVPSLTPSYTVEEFAAAPSSLGVETSDIIRAAFKVAGKDSATVADAKKIIDDFKKKEVK